MDAPHTFGSAHFAIAAKELVALHQLFKVGDDDSPEADRIRDALDAPLEAMDPIERKRAQWLSADLYSVSEPSTSFKIKEMNPQAEQGIQQAAKAWEHQDWDRALDLLRRWRDYLAPAQSSFRRGAIWRGAGHLDVAAMFYGYAYELEPANELFQAGYLNCLAESDPELAAELAEPILLNSNEHSPAVVTLAARIQQHQPNLAENSYRDLITILNNNLLRLTQERAITPAFVATHTMNILLLAVCHRSLGEFDRANQTYTSGIAIDPTNAGLFALRGVLSYSSPDSIRDLYQAVQLRSHSLWPAFLLAHHALITEDFDSCLNWCDLALSKSGSNAAKSELENWRAITQATRGLSPDLVRDTFERAVQLDPTNQVARRNQAIFEASLATPGGHRSARWERESPADVQQFAQESSRQIIEDERWILAA